MSMRPLVVLLVVASVTVRAQPVPPIEPDAPSVNAETSTDAPSAEFVAMVQEALREFGLGNYREAADIFRAAYRIRPSARVLRGLGKAYFEAGSYVEATNAFEQALVTTLDELSEALRSEVEDLLLRANRHVGVLQVSVTPSDATLIIAGEARRAGAVRLNEGQHPIEAEREGHEPRRMTARVVAGERRAVQITLPEIQRATSTTIVRETPRNTAAIGMGVLGAAGVVLTVTAGIWLGDRVRATSACSDPSAGVICSNGGDIDGERRAATASLTLGAASLIAGSIGLVLALRKRDEHSVEVSFTPATPGWHLRGTF